MTRYAMIDIHTGYVWGVHDAADPVTACRKIDEDLGELGRSYEEHGPRSGAHRSGRCGYLVYEAPDGFDVHDGQSDADIDRVLTLPHVATVLATRAGQE